MRDVTSKNFGLLIAYVIPGFTVLWAVSPLSPTLQQWLGESAGESPTVGGFLYVTLASVGAGMTLSAIRWLIIDRIHHATGIRKADWNFSRLQEQIAAFDLVNEHQYRHFQFYSNTLLALVLAYAARRGRDTTGGDGLGMLDLGAAVLACVLFIGSRDTLQKYYAHVSAILGGDQEG